MCSDTARMLPVSTAAVSTTWNVQLPSATEPSTVDSGSAGCQSPVKGASADTAVWIDRVAESVNTAWQTLFPPPPVFANSTSSVPSGAVSVPTRSATKVWSMPTVVEPTVVLQAVPSTEKVIRLSRPKPAGTGSDTLAPTELTSGIGTGGPVYATSVIVSDGCPVCTATTRVCGENAPTKLTFIRSEIGRPASYVGASVTRNGVAVLVAPIAMLP